MGEEVERIAAGRLREFCEKVLGRLGVPGEDARITAEVLLAADLRGIDSHGVARLGFYREGILSGTVTPRAERRVLRETATTALIDAGGGLGHPVSHQAMKLAIEKAWKTGLGLVAVRNSNHFGIAGYYAMMALESNCIGMAMTNSYVFVVPTFGSQSMLGTNPIAVAAPAGKERPYVLDMATSTIPFGKIETYDRLEKPLPVGWATDENGQSTQDAGRVIQNLRGETSRGGLFPLGGEGELLGGHKGYGLALLVDVLCGVLPGALYADLVYPKNEEGQALPAGLGHIFGAISIDCFSPQEEFRGHMDDLQQRLKDSPKADGQGRIYIHGEKEYEEAERRAAEGIPLNPKVADDLRSIGAEMDIVF